MLLLQSGDVETNPGPVTRELLTKILESQNRIASDVGSLVSKQNKMEKNVSHIKGQLAAIESRPEALETLTVKVAANEKKYQR